MRWEERQHTASMAARNLRERSTLAEAVLWKELRGRRLGGLKFRRQHPVGWFAADFCCPECSLIIELDGGVHEVTVEDDANRTITLEEEGYTVIRFRNEEVFSNLDSVLSQILPAAGAAATKQSTREEPLSR